MISSMVLWYEMLFRAFSAVFENKGPIHYIKSSCSLTAWKNFTGNRKEFFVLQSIE